jgi:2-oxoglutarate ferredoxin oxidoreductase subunit delta
MAETETTESGRTRKRFRGEVYIIRERCKGCGFCVEFCPTKVLTLDTTFNSKGYHPPIASNVEACTGCDLCGLYCPDFAIHGVRVPVNEKSKVASPVEVRDEN